MAASQETGLLAVSKNDTREGVETIGGITVGEETIRAETVAEIIIRAETVGEITIRVEAIRAETIRAETIREITSNDLAATNLPVGGRMMVERGRVRIKGGVAIRMEEIQEMQNRSVAIEPGHSSGLVVMMLATGPASLGASQLFVMMTLATGTHPTRTGRTSR